MKRNRLTQSQVASLGPKEGRTSPTLYHDGNGLYLQVTPAGVKSWLFRYSSRSRARGMGLGPVRTVSLLDARKKVRELQVQLDGGEDPLETRQRGAQEQLRSGHLFRDCAREYVAGLKTAHKNSKHHAQWVSTLERYANPVLGDMPVSEITGADVLRVIDPLFERVPETAQRVRGRIEKILSWCIVRGYRANHENPARWRGYLVEAIPAAKKKPKQRHHDSMDYNDLPKFMSQVRNDGSAGSILLQFIILTMTRTTEARKATWTEIDWDAQVWTIPGERMKAGVTHCVPLSRPALDILRYQKHVNDSMVTPSMYVFPGRSLVSPLSDAAASEFLKRSGCTSATVHGFRATARSYAGDRTDFPREVCEHALAHRLRDKVEAAYMRSTMFQKRVELMAQWAEYCLSESR
jgi:integrase